MLVSADPLPFFVQSCLKFSRIPLICLFPRLLVMLPFFFSHSSLFFSDSVSILASLVHFLLDGNPELVRRVILGIAQAEHSARRRARDGISSSS